VGSTCSNMFVYCEPVGERKTKPCTTQEAATPRACRQHT